MELLQLERPVSGHWIAPAPLCMRKERSIDSSAIARGEDSERLELMVANFWKVDSAVGQTLAEETLTPTGKQGKHLLHNQPSRVRLRGK
jgi:hypothetical protein